MDNFLDSCAAKFQHTIIWILRIIITIYMFTCTFISQYFNLDII